MAAPEASVSYNSLKNKTVFVSGGGSGIGAAIVTAFARQGCRVGFVDRAPDPSKKLVDVLTREGATVAFEACDVTDIPALEQGITNIGQALGPITILVNNAAHDERHDIASTTEAYWDERMAVNLKHQFFAARAIWPMMKAAGGGSIINMGSIAWRLNHANLPAYVTAKAGIEGLTRGLARDFGPDNIRVNCIAPGWIMTERQVSLWLTPEAEKKLMVDQCLKRKLVPEDIARVALFLASDEAGGCTAQTFTVDGGWV